MKYKVNDYVIEADNRLELLEKIIAKEKIKIEEVKEENGKFIFLSQQDPRWAKEKIGKSHSTIGGYGCTITSISMLSSWYGKYKSPYWMATNLDFTDRGLVLWNSMNKLDLNMRFVWRYSGNNEAKIKEILFSKDNSVIAEVNYGKHWVVIIGYSNRKGFLIADPFYGDKVYLKDRYLNITGFAEFTRK
ncbi:MAG: C39 family peptidase [Parcubacteria group bacterium]